MAALRRGGAANNMHQKSMNREELETIFQKYRDMPVLNEVELLAPPSMYAPKAGALRVQSLRKEHDAGETVTIAKAAYDLWSAKQSSPDGNHSYTTTMTFAPETVPAAQALYDGADSTTACRYVHMRGHIQTMRPHVQHPQARKFQNLLYDIVCGEMGLSPRTAREVGKLTGFGTRARVERTHFYVTDVKDGSALADAMRAAGQTPAMSRARIAGLVYMPPSLQPDGALQFRIRVPRLGLDGTDMPKDYRTEEGYDFVNVLVKDEQRAEELFDRVQQGHPVYVEGSAESKKFWKRVHPKNLGQVAKLLDIPCDAPAIRSIRRFFDGTRQETPVFIIPGIDVWADRVLTDEDEIRAAVAGRTHDYRCVA